MTFSEVTMKLLTNYNPFWLNQCKFLKFIAKISALNLAVGNSD